MVPLLRSTVRLSLVLPISTSPVCVQKHFLMIWISQALANRRISCKWSVWIKCPFLNPLLLYNKGLACFLRKLIFFLGQWEWNISLRKQWHCSDHVDTTYKLRRSRLECKQHLAHTNKIPNSPKCQVSFNLSGRNANSFPTKTTIWGYNINPLRKLQLYNQLQ